MMSTRRNRIIGYSVMVASIFALLMAVYTSYRSAVYTHCQANVNEALVRAQTSRAAAAEQDRDAVDRLVTDVLNARSREDSRAALERYRATRAAADAERAKNPIPAPPSQTCG